MGKFVVNSEKLNLITWTKLSDYSNIEKSNHPNLID